MAEGDEMEERRRDRRLRNWFLMRLKGEEEGEWLAMSRNVSTTGILAATAKKLAIGQPVSVTFELSNEDEPRTLHGTIVRVQLNAEDPSGAWPHRVAIEFDEEVPELEPLVEADSEGWSNEYLRDLEDGAEEASDGDKHEGGPEKEV